MIRYYSYLMEDDHLWVACSGGVDSIATAHLLRNKNIELIHYNHKIRPQNDVMEQKVREFAKEFFLPITVLEGNHNSDQREHDYREGRLDAFEWLGGKIILAHHLDDAVESYLMNCFNGVSEYLIPIQTRLSERTQIVRPFLENSKSQFQNYVKKMGLEEWIVNDDSNSDTSIRRNYIRHVVRPIIEQHYPGIDTVVKKKYTKKYKEIQNG